MSDDEQYLVHVTTTNLGGQYGASYRVLPDNEPQDDEPTRHQLCLFCGTTDWAWVLRMRPPAPRGAVAWPPALVACAPCEALQRVDDREGLVARVGERDDTAWLLEYLDQLLDAIESVHPRTR